ncbi:MAG: hypothetical protein IPJ13_14320 [Saprospiraceae bacterium]|nr:hypothetical protein [Saprospiraceae bacterium]
MCNDGIPFDASFIEAYQYQQKRHGRRAATISTRRTVKKNGRQHGFLKAVSCMDLTTLAGE